MQLKLKEIRNLLRYRIMYHVIGIYLFVILFFSFVGYGSYVLYTLWNTVSTLNHDVETYKTSTQFIGENKDLIADGVDSYNETLQKLIPDEETYFSVVTALERLAEKSDVNIKSYTIDLESTSISKLSLRVEVNGSPEGIKKLLSIYKYSGGRLVTIENVDLSTTGEALNIFLFNFYHQPYTISTKPGLLELSPKDIEFIKEVSPQM
ncbi:hypothetical protein BH09PAT2_BH09PAT2_09490 [soil metagenome]